MKFVIPALITFLVVMAGLQAVRGRVAAVPASFAGGVSLDDGLRAGVESGKPVLALVTADWCPPCQMLKRDTLTDPAVSAWIDENVVAVYVDADKDQDSTAKLGVRSLPTTVVLRDGKVVASKTGMVGPGEYLSFLETASAQ